MSVGDMVQRLIAHKTERLSYQTVPCSNVDRGLAREPFRPEECYIQVRLTDMYLAYDRKLYKRRYPALHTYARLLGMGAYVEIQQVAGPKALQGISSDLGRIITGGLRVLGPVPYRGAEVEICFALAAVGGDDLAERLLNFMSSVSHVAGAGALGVGLALAQPIKEGFDGLLGRKDTELCIGVYDTLTPEAADDNPGCLLAGYRVVAAVPRDRLASNSLWVTSGRLLIGPSREQAVAPTGFDYFVFSVERLTSRDDLTALEGISGRLRSLEKTAADRVDGEPLRKEFELLKAAVLSSPDLIHADRVRIIRGLKRRIQAVIKLHREGLDAPRFLGTEGAEPVDVGPLGDLQGAIEAVSVDEGRATSFHEIAAESL